MYRKKLEKYPNHKICTCCKKKLPKKNFRKNGKYLASRCNKCEVVKYRKHHLYSKYGITLDYFDQLLEKQNYSCAICKNPQKSKNRRLCVDHNHETGEVRGLLCDLCNTALGKFQDSRELLLRAEEYLKKYTK